MAQGVKGTARNSFTLRLNDEEVELVRSLIGPGVLVTVLRDYLVEKAKLNILNKNEVKLCKE
jgi:hypothetical protein